MIILSNYLANIAPPPILGMTGVNILTCIQTHNTNVKSII